MRVRVFIPHYFREEEGGTGYGSGRQGARLIRSIALARCLSSLLDLQRGQGDVELNIGERLIDHLPPRSSGLPPEQLEIKTTVCTDGRNILEDVLSLYRNSITCLAIELQDPRALPLKTRDLLVHDPEPADLSIYLEDDLIISDREYCDKLLWFATRTNHQMVLMPHRYERIDIKEFGILLVDGPLAPRFIEKFVKPQKNVARGSYRSRAEIGFDIAANPHSGTFALTKEQRLLLQNAELPHQGFVGPLETAATLTVLQFFNVLKPSREERDFLMIEHGHPSFSGYIKIMPHRDHDA